MREYIKNIKYIRIISIIFVLIWMYVIFRFSASSGTESSSMSGWVVDFFYKIIELFTGKNLQASLSAEHLATVHLLIRKLAHMFIYFVLSISVMVTLFTFPLKLFTRSLFSVLICFAYACTDEFHQLFVAGRGGAFTDVLVDTSGAILGVIFSLILYCVIYTIFFKYYHKKHKMVEVQ
ncbi:VanZ family protein [Breznakia pachnodae]|uniref:VanZ family protein n=1 Tax=Breznakia pachnodae TaxID=265178 RepID=A0ABU0DYV1_9FIRM|nr:VanZ family protein [Breznakia pachnodae]MDQ0359822.1 VanZ family protein [Breznakia pachnodae]